MKKRILSAGLILVMAVFTTFAKDVTKPEDLPAYYAAIDSKSGKTLFSELHSVVLVGYKSLGYDGALTAYKKTDVYPADSVGKTGLLWDMYGACGFDPNNSKTECGNYKKECDCYNREHSIPKSWWGGNKNETYSDIFHLVPTDGYVNNRRSNYAFGEVEGSGTYSYKGAKLGSPKKVQATNTVAGDLNESCSKSPVFEPLDQYKGDFARGYMGILLHYTGLDMTSGNGAAIFSGASGSASNYGLTKYGIALLLKWHRMDPVSQKEIDRNNGIQETQGNRNPFIDYPDLAEYLWGEHAGETFNLASAVATFSDLYDPISGTMSIGTNPAITAPNKAIYIGDTKVGAPISKAVTVKGANLTGAISFSLSGADKAMFSLSQNTMTQATAMAGGSLTITYDPTAKGEHEAVLVISGGGLSSVKEIKLSAECCEIFEVTMMRNGIPSTASACGGFDLPVEGEEDACDGWKFKGWIDDKTAFTEGQITKPDFIADASATMTVYAIYGKAEGGGSEGAPAGTKLWAEDFTGMSNNAPDGPTTNTVVYGDATVTYSVGNGGGTTKVYSEKLAGGVAPELLIAKNSGSFTISGLPTGDAKTMTLSFMTNKSNFTVATSTVGITVGEVTINSHVAMCEITVTGTVSAFDLTVTNTAKSDNARVDNFELTVKTAGESASITYKKMPCTVYKVMLADEEGSVEGGIYSANTLSATAGSVIELDEESSSGYVFDKWQVTNTATSASVEVTNNSFVMPAADVTVKGTFKVDSGGQPSPVEEVEGVLPASKVVENGVLYIIRGGRKYSVQGVLVE